MFDVDITMALNGGRSGSFLLRSSFRAEGRRLVLFGPSGSGKTMTLRAMAGLATPDAGHIRINGTTLYSSSERRNLPPRKRSIGFIFQDYALFPHMTVRQNIRFGACRMWRRMTQERRERVEELISLFGLAKVADSLPREISGGQKQRVAMARGLASEPRLLLLDEPFSALDIPLRRRMHEELTKTLEHFELPMVLVTHSLDELASFADTVVVMDQGEVKAVEGAPGSVVDLTRVQDMAENAFARTLGNGDQPESC